ncbi:Probable inactive poly [ADP-ribose] polymerase SRO2 [Linum perenne]
MVSTSYSPNQNVIRTLLQEQRTAMVAPAIGEEEQAAISFDDDDDILKPDYDSSGESCTGESLRTVAGFSDFNRVGFASLPEDSAQFSSIEKCFRHGLGKRVGDGVTVTAVHRNLISVPNAKAKFFSFRIHEKAVAERRGDSNTRFAWYGGSRDEIRQILSFGFSRCTGGGGNGQRRTHGVGVHLSPISFPTDCLEAATVDDDGTKHFLLCRVLLGRTEAVPAGSNQSAPSSIEFDTGVDDVANPRRYTVWSSFMNSHIFPAFIVSFKDPTNLTSKEKLLSIVKILASISLVAHSDFISSFPGLKTEMPQGFYRRPTSPWMSFPALLSVLSGVLDGRTMSIVSKNYDDFKRQRITREQLIRKLRQTVGDELLTSLIKSNQKKLSMK